MFLSKLPQPLQKLIPILLIVLTVAIFGYFFVKHPQLKHALATTNPAVLAVIVGLYIVMLACLTFIYSLQLKICGHAISLRENALLTGYSTIANFFGPLQSGPGVRAVYLKQKHNVKLRDYTIVSLVYYAFFAVISVALLLFGSVAWWLSGLGVITVGALSYGIIAFARHTAKELSNLTFKPQLLLQLFALTMVQLLLAAFIYGIELHALHIHATWKQTLSFTGAGNFALFVSLTPGAIGFRESFQVFARRLHHLSTTTILAVSVIDRAAYLLFLLVLFVIILAFHAQDKLGLGKPTETAN
jgi:uncharacterized membrane protein YbhN (UPF0104 family)